MYSTTIDSGWVALLGGWVALLGAGCPRPSPALTSGPDDEKDKFSSSADGSVAVCVQESLADHMRMRRLMTAQLTNFWMR